MNSVVQDRPAGRCCRRYRRVGRAFCHTPLRRTHIGNKVQCRNSFPTVLGFLTYVPTSVRMFRDENATRFICMIIIAPRKAQASKQTQTDRDRRLTSQESTRPASSLSAQIAQPDSQAQETCTRGRKATRRQFASQRSPTSTCCAILPQTSEHWSSQCLLHILHHGMIFIPC